MSEGKFKGANKARTEKKVRASQHIQRNQGERGTRRGLRTDAVRTTSGSVRDNRAKKGGVGFQGYGKKA